MKQIDEAIGRLGKLDPARTAGFACLSIALAGDRALGFGECSPI